MTTIRCQAVLFDMDGVLVDSTQAVARVWRKWAIEHGFDPEKVVRAAHGRPSLDTVRDFLPNADGDAENLEVERQEVEDLVTAADINHGKPHPEPYQRAAQRLGYPASECIVVEDAPAGIRAGKAAGARVIAVPTTSPRSALESAGADWVVRNCADISAALDERGLVLTLST